MATAKVIIAGQNNIGPAFKSVQGDISSLSNVAQKAVDTLKKAFTITAIVASSSLTGIMECRILRMKLEDIGLWASSFFELRSVLGSMHCTCTTQFTHELHKMAKYLRIFM